MIEVIFRASINPKCDPEKMRALLDMQRSIAKDEARMAFTRAFNELQSSLPVITRDGFIDHGDGLTAKGNKKLKTSYSTYPNLMGVCRPRLKQNGFTFNNVIEPSLDGVKADVVGYLTHVGGHAMVSRFPLMVDVTGKKNNQQGFGSGASYGKRYNLIMLLDIVSEAPMDQDRDGARVGPAPGSVGGDFPGDIPFNREPSIDAEGFAKLVEAIADCGVTQDQVLKKYRIKNLKDLPASLLEATLTSCANYKLAHAKEGT